MPIDLDVIISVLLSLVAALVMSFAATPVVKSFAKRVGAMDVPRDNRRMHDHPIPRQGGLAIFLGFILSVVFFAEVTRQIQGILLGSVIVVIVGAIDDILDIKPWIKFVAQTAAALVAVYHGVVIDVLSNPIVVSNVDYISLGWAAAPMTVVWIVAITNAVNWIDGLDGLSVGVSGIASVTMLVIALIVSNGNTAIVMAALAGACIGFMPYNLNPAKIFAGDTGALLLGYVLSTMSIIGLFKFYAIVSFAVPFLILALPIFDVVFNTFRRIFHGQKPWVSDRGHVHHRLIDMGLTQKQAVAILYCISTVLGLAAVVLTASGEIRAIIFLLAFTAAAAIGIFILRTARHDTRERGDGEPGGDGRGERGDGEPGGSAQDAAHDPDAADPDGGDPDGGGGGDGDEH
ncbi:MAG: undecaprenyl/decaprenyl-phosphate alpha-N-acetylglucosaminyl 1-phosphate transferase [Oscillospiraceae bacterium]|jgi:UDP-GlcNAc:undecaprenyl-phosphate GlcNAc-1-phosphate transferase|nr:undecaprenyl/decaprenyl-phosphate alpha-N-acetylglucosaminyl 1-phosphate transferase [Oscillospiraceae bacterium]